MSFLFFFLFVKKNLIITRVSLYHDSPTLSSPYYLNTGVVFLILEGTFTHSLQLVFNHECSLLARYRLHFILKNGRGYKR